MGKSSIEWCTDVWNPISGCSHSGMPGCDHCWAKEMHRRLRTMGQPKYQYDWNEVRCHPEELERPLRWRKPRRVFVCSMSDLFHEDVPDEFITELFGVMAATPQHTYQLLTKRPKRMRRLLRRWAECGMPIPGNTTRKPLPNVWLGASASTQKDLERVVPDLLKTPAAVRFVSLEPLLGEVELSPFVQGWYVEPRHVCGGDERICYQRCPEPEQVQCNSLDWVIAGAESGPNRRKCDYSWVVDIVNQCEAAKVPVFVKQIHTGIENTVVKMPKVCGLVWDQMPATHGGLA